MAQKIHIVLEDDLDGTEATQTVSFGLDGTSYEIDLNDEHAAELREALAGYVGHARKVGGAARRSGGGARKAAASGGATPGEIRAWAAENGYDVPERGRISAEVRSAYEAAH
ncbi:Lsr2 family protein [Nocardioides sp. TRM66260-LWL]|uniref:histone-like nucleoid-structuring protein Lsr2 n=1 Tax=Nocardioides sp. TRM66260-LWL TaxID=2874478 RepID=UPI001CC63B99|nr:Lsr2 family protein [Nocardioides sp. TRM66260-LWL]MBZ5734861.1 Lsr2 family protein [Nocardioides sp. TRM66260-LWL]